MPAHASGVRARAHIWSAAAVSLLILLAGAAFPTGARAALSLDSSGCAGAALAFAGTANEQLATAADCTLTFGNDSGDVQLRTYQADGVAPAMPGFDDYAVASDNWATNDEMFGACLRTLSAAPTSAWTRPGDGTCTAIDSDPWYPVPATSGSSGSVVAELTTGSYTAGLRFGARTATGTPPGSYTAPIVVEVVQPTAPAPSNLTLPTISGTTTTGQALSTTDGTWSGSPSSYAYQWRRCDASGASCADISGATSSSYTLAAGDVDATIRVVVTATNGSGSTPATSAQTAVIAGIAPTAGTVSISGTSTSEQTLTASLAGWTTGSPAGTTSYQWRRCDAAGADCVDIAGATSSTLTLGGADVDATIRVVATRANSCTTGCASVNATSNQTAQVAGLAPTADTATITGVAGLNQTLTAAETGTWTSGSPVASPAYQWKRCDAAGNGCVDIAGATASTYTVDNPDVDLTLRVVITRTNACATGCGMASATSPQTAPIEPIPYVGGTSASSSSGGSSSITVTTPPGTLAGHLMVAQISVRGGTDQIITPPAGWTLIRRTNNSNRVALASYYRFATGSEGGQTFTWTDTDTATGAIVSFANVDVTTPVDVTPTSATGTAASQLVAGVTPTVANTTLVALHAVRGGAGSYTAPAGMTERHDLTANLNITSLFATQRWTSTAATGSRTATSTINDDFAAQLIALRPAP